MDLSIKELCSEYSVFEVIIYVGIGKFNLVKLWLPHSDASDDCAKGVK